MTLLYKINQLVQMEAKDPLTRRKYTVNMASVDATNDATTKDTGFLQSRTISSIVVTTPTGITLVSSSNTTTSFTLEVSGGTANSNYEFDVLVTLSTSEVENVTVSIQIRDAGLN